MANNIMHGLFDGKINVMGGTLGLRLARHDLAAGNLANMDTPGFRAKHLNFEEVLANQLTGEAGRLQVTRTHENHIPTKDPGRAFARANQAVQYSPYGWDENDDDILDIDKEMTLLTKNQLIYNTTVQMLAKSFEGLKAAMNDSTGG